MKNRALIGFILGIVVVAFQGCKTGDDNKWQGPANGTGYSGLRPDAGVYSARLTCASSGAEGFENLTVKDDSDIVLIENECTQQSSEVQITDVSYQPYRKDHLGHKDQIYEKNMPRDPLYYNEAMCDFADKKFGILIRFYDQTIFHVGHIFTMNGATAFPVVRLSDVTLPGPEGYTGTAYMGDNFELAVVNSYPIGDGFVGVFNGKVDNEDIHEAVGFCITTVYTCNPIQLTVSSAGTAGAFTITSTGGTNTIVAGTMIRSTEIPDIYALDLDVGIEGKGYDCTGYVHTMTNELSIGGCLDRPSDGSDPKRVMVQVRGIIQWQTTDLGTVNSKVCTGDLLRDP